MKNLMEYNGYYAKIQYSDEDSVFFGVIDGIRDSISFEGSNVEELKEAFHEAVEDYIDICKRHNREPEKYYKGSFNVRIDPMKHKKLALMAMSENMSLNQLVDIAISEKLEQASS